MFKVTQYNRYNEFLAEDAFDTYEEAKEVFDMVKEDMGIHTVLTDEGKEIERYYEKAFCDMTPEEEDRYCEEKGITVNGKPSERTMKLIFEDVGLY